MISEMFVSQELGHRAARNGAGEFLARAMYDCRALHPIFSIIDGGDQYIVLPAATNDQVVARHEEAGVNGNRMACFSHTWG